MLILLTLSFLPTANRTSTNMSDVIRNVSHLISKKHYALPPNLAETKLRNSDPLETTTEDSADVFRNVPHLISKKHYALSPNFAATKLRNSDPLETTTEDSADVFRNVSHLISKKHYALPLNLTKTKLRKSFTLEATTEDSADVIRNVSHLISKKHYALSPNFAATKLRNSDTLETTTEDSAEIYRNTHDVRIVDQPPGRKTHIHFSYNKTAPRLTGGAVPQTGNLISPLHQLLGAFSMQKPSQRLHSQAGWTGSSLAPGDILNGDVMFTQRPKKDPYILGLIKEMESRNTGYLSMAFEAMCEILSLKSPDYVRSIVQHTQSVIAEMTFKMNRFQWLEEPMSTILRDVAGIVSAEPVDEMQTRAIILKALMRDRRNIVGADVNIAFNLADNLISREEGEHLFEVLLELKKFPNCTKTEKEMCQDTIQAFEDPFFHKRGSGLLKRMVKKANQAFIDRFPSYNNVRSGKVTSRPNLVPDSTTSHTSHSHSNKKKPHSHKHRQKKTSNSTVKKPHRKTQGNSTKSPEKAHTRRRKIKPIKPNILLG